MIVHQMLVGHMANFNYLIGDPETRTAAIIDPAWQPDHLLAEADRLGLTITHILNTHCHHDHVEANGPIKEATGATIHIHEEEFRYLAHFEPPPGDVSMSDGDTIQIGQLTLHWMHTPGHSPGSSSIRVNDAVFVGDTLFVNSIGRTNFPGSEPADMFASIQKLKALPDTTTIYPGHDYGPTQQSTIGEQKQLNPFWQPESLEAFMVLAQPDNDQIER